jgi:pre-mRNA-processing factor 17
MKLNLIGPTHPSLKRSINVGLNNHHTGVVESYHVDDLSFNDQYHTFNAKGFAYDPSGLGMIGNIEASKSKIKPEKKKRKPFGDPSDSTGDSFNGPWAPYEHELLMRHELQEISKTTAEQLEEIEALKKPKKETPKEERVQAKSIFHGSEMRDYLGRSFIEPPSHLKPDLEHENFMPKKAIHTWRGHDKGVNAVRFFPRFGNLLLSAGLDGKVKLWDVYGNMQCQRSYLGHSKAVRDICFTNDGRRFVSCSYDRYINYWDTETGECLGSYTNSSVPYCVKFNPDPDKQHMILTGCSDKKIIQYDLNSGKITQEYDQHLGSVNSVTFIDDNRRFVSTSDDKTIRVWEFGIPVTIKYMAEPHMHSMPAVVLHPKEPYFLAQSLDNQILVYNSIDRFRQNRKKRFAGHVVAGYACQVSVSPDGHFVVSGDSEGRVWFWDWNNNRVLKTMKAHQAVCMGVEWHPIENSKMVTCGWDGDIHYWD